MYQQDIYNWNINKVSDFMQNLDFHYEIIPMKKGQAGKTVMDF